MTVNAVENQARNLEKELRALFREGVDGARERQATEFDRLTGRLHRSLVLFGCGRLGRRTLAGLRRAGIQPLAFVDNNPGLWNTTVDGVPVLSPIKAAPRYASAAAFVVAIWTAPMSGLVGQLRSLGCTTVTSFVPLYWKYPQVFLPYYTADLPHYVQEQREAILAAWGLWEDQTSRREFLNQVAWRLDCDFDRLPACAADPIYFPPGLFSLPEKAVFVDCGAFDGDTILSFLEQRGTRFRKILAYGPDPANFRGLQASLASRPEKDSIVLRNAAVWSARQRLAFSGGAGDSSSTGAGEMVVEGVTLDHELTGIDPDFIKMDIEGAELEALAGARQTIARSAPLLAVSCYHRQDHLWRIPLLINSFLPRGYSFHLRAHRPGIWDLVCYAVPKPRAG